MGELSEWVVCQLGAREHYAVARSLARHGVLRGVFTDAWVPPNSVFSHFDSRLRQRFHPELASIQVGNATRRLCQFEALARIRRYGGWKRITRRNEWFQKEALRWLAANQSILEEESRLTSEAPTLFAYSYAARDLLLWAKKRGWATVLGQIDAGIEDERLMEQVYCESGTGESWNCAPANYWQSWHDEIQLADKIVVNSNWSRDLIARCGIDSRKLSVIPLSYEGCKSTLQKRSYPDQFSHGRPLRILFLGQVTIRKGVLVLLEAARLLRDQPIEFHFVGPIKFELPPSFDKLDTVFFHGSVPRDQTERWYRESDIFVFPTHSDGFGLTQLEALSNGLPVIASANCGEVVRDEENGRKLFEISSVAIVQVIEQILDDPRCLHRWSEAASVEDRFKMMNVGRSFLECLKSQ